MGFPRIINGSERMSVDTASSETNPVVGAKMVIEDGRTFRYCEAGGTALINANTISALAPSTNFRDEAVDTLAAGVTVLTGVAATGSNPAADLFKNGYVHVLTAAQLGPVMRVKSNPLFAGNAGSLTLYNPLPVAITVDDKVTYVENAFRDVIIAGTNPAALIVGVAVRAVLANQYGWLATGGPARVFQDTNDVPAVGNGCMASDQVAGTVEDWLPETNAGKIQTYPIGICMAVQTSAEKAIIFLKLDE